MKIIKTFFNEKITSSSKLSMPRKHSLVNLARHQNLAKVLRLYSWKIISILNERRIKGLNQVRLFHKFGSYVYVLSRRHGVLFVVKYLKACSLAIQRAVAGSPMSSLRELEPDLPLPRLSSTGLPVIIGTRDRRAILSGSRKAISLYLSLFGLYRVIDAPVKAKLGTITDPFLGDPTFLQVLGHWFGMNSGQLLKAYNKGWDLKVFKPKLITKSSPSNSISWKGLVADLAPLLVGPIRVHVLTYLRETGSLNFYNSMVSIFESVKAWPVTKKAIIRADPVEGFVPTEDLTYRVLGWDGEILLSGVSRDACVTFCEKKGYQLAVPVKKSIRVASADKLPIGQLSFKKEAAGKLRVFAMVDVWTQSILSPLHDSLFSILKGLPNDGTMDQEASFARAQDKAREYGCAYGYDLSAATDRLPLEIQKCILGSLSGNKALANAWGSLLVDRSYVVPANDFGVPEGALKYEVGQPMGALSSWAMLAITHHMVMQYCSAKAYPQPIGTRKWEERYEVLGDDIVIFDALLASTYLQVMGLLGVPINESKSVVTLASSNHKVVEFAKRTSVDGVDCSPLSWKMFVSQDSYPGRLAIIDWLARRRGIFGRFYHIVLSKAIWDRRPEKDHVGAISFFISHLLSGKGDWRAIVPWFLEGAKLSWKDGKLVSTGLPVRTIAAYVASWYKGEDKPVDLLWSRAATKLENEYRLSLMDKRARILSSISLDAHVKAAKTVATEAGASNSIELINLIEKALRAPMMKVQLLKGMDVSNYPLDKLIDSVKRCQLIKNQFDIPLVKKDDQTRFELDTVPLSVLDFTKSPVKDPKRNFDANFGASFSMKGPPVNKPKDKFGFNF